MDLGHGGKASVAHTPMRYQMLIGLVLLALLLLLWSGNVQAPTHVSTRMYDLLLANLLSHSVPEISVDRLASKHILLLDAREYREFDVSHIEGALWVGYGDFTLTRLVGIDQHTPLAVYCSVGYRSERIAEALLRLGYTNVSNVYGGIFEWINTGHSVVTVDGTETNQIHAYSKFWGIWLTRGERIYE